MIMEKLAPITAHIPAAVSIWIVDLAVFGWVPLSADHWLFWAVFTKNILIGAAAGLSIYLMILGLFKRKGGKEIIASAGDFEDLDEIGE